MYVLAIGSKCMASEEESGYDDEKHQKKKKYVIDSTNRQAGIERTFKIMVLRIWDSFEERCVKVPSLVRYFQEHSCIFGDVSEKVMSELRITTTIGALHQVIKKYYSFCNFNVIEDLVELYGSNDDKRNLKEYIGKFKRFCFSVHEHQLRCGSNLHGKQVVTFKLDHNETFTGEVILQIKRRVSVILEIEQVDLHLKQIRDGCLSFDFLVSEIYCDRILQARTADKVKMFQEFNITYMEAYPSLEKVPHES